MAEKTLNTRILLKYDTYANWTTNNPVLKAGEMAIATIVTGNTQEVNSVTAPQVLIKVGDGTSAYNSLPFVSAKAADVYSWAKASEKPTYAANEITGISDYIAEYVKSEMGISVDTDTQYQIIRGADDYTYKLQSKGKGDSAWADVSTITIPKYDDTALAGRVTSLEGLVGSTAVATQIANAITALDLANTYAAKEHEHEIADVTGLQDALDENADAISAIKDGTSIDSFADVESALAEKQATGDYATKAQAQGYADAKDEAIAAAKKAGDDAQADIDAYQTSNDAVIAAIKDGANIDSFKDVEDAIAAHKTEAAGAYETKTDAAAKLTEAKGYTNQKISDLLDGATDETLNSIKELADAIKENDSAIDALNEVAGSKANASDLNALTERVGTAEGEIDALQADSHKHDNKSVLDGITAAKVTAWDAAEANAKAYTDELESELATIAKSGNVNDLVQTSGDVLIFNCGSSDF